jgi:hypothetical protein
MRSKPEITIQATSCKKADVGGWPGAACDGKAEKMCPCFIQDFSK